MAVPETGATATGGPRHRPNVVLSVGKLDGVHAGHRHLVARVLAESDARHAAPCAVVLHPDPATVLRGTAIASLTTVEERAQRLRALGVKIVEPLHFTPEVAGLEPAAFLDRVTERFRLSAIVAGPDFAFGRDRSGDLAALERIGRARGFEVVVVPPLEAAGEWLSSRRLRALVEAGDVAVARTLMRHPPRVIGTVVHGAARGRQLGFPTANLDPSADFALPANGIYTVRASWPGAVVDGVASVGVRPTFDNGARLVEVHLLDFEGNLYGREISVDFLARQREEHRFETIGGLVDQMHRDVDAARDRLAYEARLGLTIEADGRRARARGLDLADVCERLAEWRGARRASSPPLESSRWHTVSVRGNGEQAVLEAWLAALASPGALGPGRRLGTHVYYAGRRTLHAMVRARDVPGEIDAPPTTRLRSYARTRHGVEVEVEMGS